jgi:3-oxoacyl-[acyl-carrier protein] reductase
MKNGKLNGKVAVVTGASKGIGAGIAKEFAAEGASVVVNYVSAKQDADRVVDEISKRSGKAIAIQGDVAKKADVERLFAEAEKAFGKIDILVNNAGVYEFVVLEEVTEQQFHRMFDTNVLGMLLATQEALKHFNPDGGSIINIGSLASVLTPPTGVVYNEGRCRRNHADTGEGTRSAQNPRQRDQARDGDHRRSDFRRFP